MKSVFGDHKTFQDAFIHFLLADVLFAAFLGGSIEFIILFIFRSKALFAFQGFGGMVVEAAVTWLSVFLSARMMRRTRHHDSIGIAVMATGFSLLTALIAAPYLGFFSEISHAPLIYLVLKEALHTSVFYSATMVYFSGMSIHSLFKEASSQTA